MWNEKMKFLTFSYDDGVTQDRRLVEIFNKYGLKATFNINSELLGGSNSLIRDGVEIRHDKISVEEVTSLYKGHEVAAHTLTHPSLKKLDDDSEIIRQVEEDRRNLSALVGYDVVGFAYPGGGKNYDSRIAELIRQNTGVKYARGTISTHSFNRQENLYEFNPTVYHHVEMDKMFELGKQFLDLSPSTPQCFYIFGHAYEFDIRDEWGKFEEFCRMMSGRDDIFYGTNKEILLDLEGSEGYN